MRPNENENTAVEKKDFDKVIGDIETTLDCAFKLPPFGTVVSANDIRKQLKLLKKAVNEAIEDAEHIMGMKEKILSEARQEADEIVRRRQLEISKQTVIKEAEMYAKAMLTKAKEEAERMKREAEEYQHEIKARTYQYADMVFDEIVKVMDDNRKKVVRNRQDLKTIIDDKRDNVEDMRRKLS